MAEPDDPRDPGDLRDAGRLVRDYAGWLDDGFTPFDAAALRAASTEPDRDDAPRAVRPEAGAPGSAGRLRATLTRPGLRAAAAAIVLLCVVAGVAVVRRAPEQAEVHTVAEPPWGWLATARFPVPANRSVAPGADPVWTGTEVVLPGALTEPLPTGGTIMRESPAYNPATDTWRLLPEPPLDLLGADADGGWGDAGSPALWTGRELLVFGRPLLDRQVGQYATTVTLALDPATGTWRQVASHPRLAKQRTDNERVFSQAFWTGSEALLVEQDGAAIEILDPATGAQRVVVEPSYPTCGYACPDQYPAGDEQAASVGHQVLLTMRRGGELVARLFDPSDATFRPATAPPEVLDGLIAAGDDVVGHGPSGYHVWHVATDTWTSAPAPPPTMTAPAARTTGNGTQLVTWGGSRVVHLSGRPDPPTTVSPEPTGGATFDPATGVWQKITSSPDLPDWWLGGVWMVDRLFTWGGGVPEHHDIDTIIGATWTPRRPTPGSTATTGAGGIGSTRPVATGPDAATAPTSIPTSGTTSGTTSGATTSPTLAADALPDQFELGCVYTEQPVRAGRGGQVLAQRDGVHVLVHNLIERSVVVKSSAGDRIVPPGDSTLIYPNAGPGRFTLGCESAPRPPAELTVVDRDGVWVPIPDGCPPAGGPGNGIDPEPDADPVQAVRWWGDHRPGSFIPFVEGDEIVHAGWPDSDPPLYVHRRGDALVALYWVDRQPDGRWVSHPVNGCLTDGTRYPAGSTPGTRPEDAAPR